MSWCDHFQQRADECLRLSGRARAPDDRELLRDLARAWRGLVDPDNKSDGAAIHLTANNAPELH